MLVVGNEKEMPITKPYFRIYRNFSNNNTFDSHEYITDGRNLQDIQSIAHAYYLLEMDLKTIFDYITPSQSNKLTYSHRIYELFLRACTEFENNASALLKANNYSFSANPNIKNDYFKINKALKLNNYEVKLNIWEHSSLVLQPFSEWSGTNYQPLKWYKDYNSVKHDRTANFNLANLENLLNAVAGVAVILFAQFKVEAFSPFTYYTTSPVNGYYSVGGSIFDIKPHIWDNTNSYDFDWNNLKNQQMPFEFYPF